MFRSIRSRLALSFAAIALLAALAIGALLLPIMQNYYADRELSYLRGNAKIVASEMLKPILGNLPHDDIQSQIANLAFLSQTRLRVYNANGELLADSGTPDKVDVSLGVAPKLPNQVEAAPLKDGQRIIAILDKGSIPIPSSDKLYVTPSSDKQQYVIYRSLSVSGSPYGFELDSNSLVGGPRSSQIVKQAITDPNGNRIGSIVLSDGPALGNDIVKSVAQGWAVASILAVLLAGMVGWFISRRISAPVLALTAATSKMGEGDLSTRANVGGRDEFGQLAQSFNDMAEQVEGTVVTLRRFVSDAAHELQTPVTALRTDLDLATGETGQGEQRVFLQRAQATVQHLQTLNRNLLDLSRLEARTRPEPDSAIDLCELVQGRVEVYASQAEQAGLILETDLHGTAPICAAPIQVARVLDNVFDNAVKFTPAGGVITISVSTDADVCLSVSDTGIGIPIDDLTQLFSRFHRGRNATAYPGSGLGLAIVKAIVEQQGGSVSAENIANGARFTVRWPLTRIGTPG